MKTRFLPIFFALITQVSAGLQFTIYQRQTECFYIDKEEGEFLDGWFEKLKIIVRQILNFSRTCFHNCQVSDSDKKISFAVFDPSDNILQKETTVHTAEVNLQVNKTGAYGICFSGNQLTSSVNVFFDFDPEVSNSIAADINEKLSNEKRKFLDKILHTIKYEDKFQKDKLNLTEQFMMDVVRNQKDQVVDKNPNAGVENSLLYISILADRMSAYMQKHKVNMRRQQMLQEANKWNVNFFSTLISSTIFVSACVQLIVLKSFFTGTISLKVWQF